MITKFYLGLSSLILTGCVSFGGKTLQATAQRTNVESNSALCEILIEGEINNRTSSEIQRLLTPESEFDSKCKKATVIFSSLGGYFYPSITIGRLIRSKNYVTKVKDGEECSSACATAFIGGIKRNVSGGKTRIGLHQFSKVSGDKIECFGDNSDEASINDFKRYLKEMLDERAAEYFLTTKDSVNCRSVIYLKRDELMRSGLITF